MMRSNLITALVATLTIAGIVHASPQHAHGKSGEGQKALPNCPVTGEPINFAVSTPMDDGPVFFCCDGCISKFQKDPAKHATKVGAQRKALAHRAKVQVTCPVSKKPVDSKIFVENKGQKTYFCCKGCAGKYESDPAKYASALANSYTYQTKCPVMGGDIAPEVFSKLSTGETIYYCCAGCDKPLLKNPVKYNKNLVSQGILINWAEVKKGNSGKGHDGHDHGAHGHGDHGH